MLIFFPRIPKLITISECVKMAAVHPPNIADAIELDASITDEKIAPYPTIETGEDSVKHSIFSVSAKSFCLRVFPFIFDKSVFQKPWAMCNKNSPANRESSINTVFGMAEMTAFAHSAPVMIKIISPIIQPKMQKKPALYPRVMAMFAVVKNTGPTDIKTTKHRQNVLIKR